MRKTVSGYWTAKRVVCGAVLMLAIALTGCGGAVVGRWQMVEAIPNREVFSISKAHFQKGGTFTATTTIEGLTADLVGKYTFNGFRLKLYPEAGGHREYMATVKPGRLDIRDGDRKVIMRKVGKGS